MRSDATVLLPPGLLPLLGTIGLILIVLEGGLDLNLKPGRRKFLLAHLFRRRRWACS